MASRRRIVFVLGAVALLALGAMILARRHGSVDLRVLADLHPMRKELYQNGDVSYTFSQPMEDIERVLDSRLNESTGWEAGGGVALNYVWYHRSGWRTFVSGLMSDIGISGTMVYMKADDKGNVVLTVANGDAILP